MIKLKKIRIDQPHKIKVITNTIIKNEYVENYVGNYIVIPLAYQQQELKTKNKLMKENVVVKEVPFFEVSNVEGTTIYIGSEV